MKYQKRLEVIMVNKTCKCCKTKMNLIKTDLHVETFWCPFCGMLLEFYFQNNDYNWFEPKYISENGWDNK